MLTPSEYASYDALGLKELVDKSEVTPKELHDTASRAIEALNPELNFMVEYSPDAASQSLASLNPKAPFAGIPFLVKDGSGLAGLSLASGSRLGVGTICEADPEHTKRLKRSGLIILGSTNTPEIGSNFSTESLLNGAARNPWNMEHSTGGSSGGASSAVAAGVVPMAQSSDGAGSIRVPAHFCGVFGLMPTRGRTPLANSFALGGGLIARQHVTTRTVRDSAAMLDQLHGPEHGALYRVAPPVRPYLEEVGANPGRLKIAFSTVSPSGEPVSPECIAAVEQAVQLCSELGHTVEEAAPQYSWDEFMNAFSTNWAFVFSYFEQLSKATGKTIGPDTLEISTLRGFEKAQALTGQDIYRMLAQFVSVNTQVDAFFDDWDIFISPVSLTAAPLLGVFDSNAPDIASFEQWFDRIISKGCPFTPVFNSSGHPGMSVPLSQSEAGLPVGVQCIARVGDEATLFRLASQFERACPWRDRNPPISLF